MFLQMAALAADAHLAGQLLCAEPVVHKETFFRSFELAHEG
jgi:hypothetical protein